MDTKARKLWISPIEHFTGARLTRTTYAAAVTLTDDSTVDCGHEAHPDKAAAIKCAKRLATLHGWNRVEGPIEGEIGFPPR